MNITSMHVTPQFPDSIKVEWEVSNPSLQDTYKFFVFISENPKGPFTQVNTLPIINELSFSFPISVLAKQEYYFLKICLEINGMLSETDAHTFQSKLTRRNFFIAREIKRKKNLQRNINIGIPVKVRKKKLYGERCCDCFDEITRMITDSHCKTCFGTSIVGGYHEAIDGIIEIVEGDRDIKQNEIGVIENLFAVGRMTDPLVFKGDIVIEEDRNYIWRVNSIQRNMIQTVPVDQKIELRLLSPKDIEYQL